MNKKVTNVFMSIKSGLTRHSPEILTGLGIGGMLTSTVLAVKATPKALRLMELKKEELGISSDEKLTVKETVQATWKCYIPAAVTATVSTACLIGASTVSAKRNAALAAAYQLSQSALTEFRESVIETVGEKKEQAIRDNANKKRIENNPASNCEVFVTGGGETLFYEPISDRYFTSDMEKVRKAENDLNKKLLQEMYVSLNDFYDEIGLKQTSLGNSIGWNLNKEGMLNFHYSALITDEGKPCIVVEHHIEPRYDYQSLY